MGTYLNRTPASAGSRTTWTWSAWVKRSGDLTQTNTLFEAYPDSSNFTYIRFAPDYIRILNFISGGANAVYNTSSLYRDVSAWYHIVWTWDTTNGTASDRSRLYVNGTRITNFSTETNPTSGEQSNINNNTAHYLGSSGSSSLYMNGYMANVYFIDGQALTPTSFGLTDSTTGIWKPKVFSGSYGSNGYRLEFKNAGALGTDTSGNSNTWTVSNADTSNQVVDTPSNNFSTFNPLIERPTQGIADFSEGNCKVGGTSDMGFSSIALPSSGKWYAEFKATAGTSTAYVGLRDVDDYTADGNSNRLFYNSNGGKDTGSGDSAYGSTWTTGDIISMACDVDNSQVVFYKNGTAQDSGTAISQNCANQYFFVATAGGWSFQANFGNPTFTISSGNSDANGYGNFEYAVPSGYYALCTENLNTYG